MSTASTASPAQSALIRELSRVLAQNEQRVRNPLLGTALDRLRAWQAARLRQTYADLAADRRFAPAIAFFESDLYGRGDFSRRDTDLMRVVPTLVRVVPEGVVVCIAQAVELNALTHELDLRMLAALPHPDAPFTVREYCSAYRRAGEVGARRRQIALIDEVGSALDRFVRRPLVRASLAMMRTPARVAGLGALQDFLERGFAAFRTMHGAAPFLAAVRTRETALLEAIMSGADEPFPDPVAEAATRAA